MIPSNFELRMLASISDETLFLAVDLCAYVSIVLGGANPILLRSAGCITVYKL